MLLVSFNANSQDPNFYIFLCFGQSNMEGQGTIESQDQTVDSRFQVMQSVSCTGQPEEQWRTATPPICRCSSGLGPADYFGRTMVDNLPSHIKVGIVHVSVSGCKIELFDKDQYATVAAGEAAWMQNIIAQYGGNPYGRLVELAKIAQQDGVIKGILLHQGESNTGDNSWPSKVNKVYTDLLSDLSLNATDVPLVAGEVVDAAQGGICSSMNSIINTLPNTIPTAHVVSSSGCTDQSDNLHFNAAGYRLLGERYALKMLELVPTVPDDYPSVTITSPASSDVFTAPADITIEVTASDPNGNVSKVEFYNGTTRLGEDVSSPYSYSWVDVADGTYKITAVATDNEGNETTSSAVTLKVNVPQQPYGGAPHAIPGTIECEEFDLGGADFAYYDDSPGTDVDPAPDYRTDEDVDIEECSDTGGGYNLGWTSSGEWLEYTTNVEVAGTHKIEIRVACNDDGRNIALSADGVSINDNISVPNTGGWQTWETVTVNDVELKAGEQVIRLTIGSEDYVNLNKMTFVAVDVPEPPVVEITFPANKGTTVIGEEVTISANATSTKASIVVVEIDVKGTVMGIDETAPYTAKWTPVSTGDYTVTAKATDSNGLTHTESISVTVIEAPATIALKKGWNLIGCPLNGEISIDEALSSIKNHILVVKDFEEAMDVDTPAEFHSLKSLSWGKGYLIKVNAHCELIWGQ